MADSGADAREQPGLPAGEDAPPCPQHGAATRVRPRRCQQCAARPRWPGKQGGPSPEPFARLMRRPYTRHGLPSIGYTY